MSQDLLAAIREVISSRRYLFTLHAIHQAEERKITPREVEQALLAISAEIIEDYPDDPRGSSCLVLGVTARGRMLHVQVTYPPAGWIITVYEPDEEKWIDARVRR
ncbi:MAG: DUF4258 domain-containing protein [Chloroflexi bacterium]|nr:DUF4258 domain-containing protein [Chloroflexota bacterium]